MQVTHSADHVTHAVIGGSKTIEFGISSSAAFFQILSSTLYSNQPLAVAREVLCNAWDAHIRAGITNVAVKVTIGLDKIKVRDFAMGIAPDMMGPLYGTYGGSDKTNNGQETGGFGLGCKAPFAYTDHFEVTSWHAGVKTIYTLSKSSADKQGKPGITPILSVPTDEDGLQVSIPMKREDHSLFLALFERVARNGEMNVEINGKKVEGIELSSSENGWLISSNDFGTASPINVRYGNVIYPVNSHLEYSSEYTAVYEFTRSLRNGGHWPVYIVFQAQPDTISVTPSRESLSMQEHTVRTVKSLLAGFFDRDLRDQLQQKALPVIKARIDQLTAEGQLGDLMTDHHGMPGGASRSQIDRAFPDIATIDDLTSQHVLHNYPVETSFYAKDLALRLDAAASILPKDQGTLGIVKDLLVSNLLNKTGKKKNQWIRTKRESRCYGPHEWFKRRVVRPLYRDLDASPVMDRARLNIFTGGCYNNRPQKAVPHDMKFRELGTYLPILRKIVVISYSQIDLWRKVQNDKTLEKLGGPNHAWFYHAPLAKTKIEGIREFFNSRGWIVIDYTEETTWAKAKSARYVPKSVTPRKPKAEGYAALSGVFKDGKPVRVDNCFLEGQPRLATPTLYARIFPSRAEVRDFELGGFHKEAALLIVKLLGDTCAVVRSEAQEKKAKEAGLMELDDYVMNRVFKTVTSARFEEYWSQSLCRAFGHKDGTRWEFTDDNTKAVSTRLFDFKEVRDAFGLTVSLTDDELLILSIWREMATAWRYKNTLEAEEARKFIVALPVGQEIQDIVTDALGDSLLSLFSCKKLTRLLQDPSAINRQRLAKVTYIALKG